MILLLALVILALCATAASASTTISYDPATGALVQGDGAGEGVQITTLTGPDRLEVARSTLDGRVTRATLVPGNGCQAGGTDVDGQITNVRCQLPSSRIVTANLGDGADGFRGEPGQSASVAGLFVEGGGGDDLVTGVATADQIRGGPGSDQLTPGGGNDVVEGGDGNDRLAGDGGGTTTIRGGAGNDTLVAGTDLQRSVDLFDGGTGVDTADYSARATGVTLKASLLSTPTPDDGKFGEGDDLDGVDTLIGGSAADTLEFSNSILGTVPRGFRATLRGNAGDDFLKIVNGIPTSLDGGLGQDTVRGGSAVDNIFSREGEHDTITCGASSLDIIKPDLADNPLSADCENLDQSDRREGPNVAFRTSLARVHEDGALSVRLACPRSVRIGCRGGLSARLDRRGTRFGGSDSYSLRPGRSATVEVGLPTGQVAAARRPGARVRVRSVERGVHGPKTTQRSLPGRRA
jgi:Ca2+-binding RTX toxin-like protein